MTIPFTRRWRAPKWMPLFVRRRFMGVWTQGEVDAIHERARRSMAEFIDWVD